MNKMANKVDLRICLTISIFLSAIVGPAQAATITVGSGAGYDFDTIQAGIDAAVDGDTVLVAPGEYVISEPVTFRGKAITVISEAGRDETTIRMGTPVDPKRASVVVFENNETAASVLDGFTITGGGGLWESEYGTWGGGGIEFYASSGTVRNCAIVRNKITTGGGGGVDCWHNSTPTVINCIIRGNSAPNGGALLCGQNSAVTVTDCVVRDNSSTEGGGGVACWQNSLATLTNCIIRGNTSGGEGGGVACWENSTVTMTDCVIKSNKGYDYFGGGVYVGHSSATLTNCVIARNTVALGGGGVACSYPDASLTINNCTIWGNSGGASYGGGGVLCRNASATVTNSIIWGNTSPKGPEISVEDPSSTLTIVYSNVAGGQTGVSVEGSCTLNWGADNIDTDPLFARLGYLDKKALAIPRMMSGWTVITISSHKQAAGTPIAKPGSWMM